MTHGFAMVVVIVLAGCVAKETNTARVPADPPVSYPDAETVVIDDRGMIVGADADAGVGDLGPIDDDGGVPTYWNDVYPIVFRRCVTCHLNEDDIRAAGLPAIVTYAQTQAMSTAFPGQRLYERMAARVLNAQGLAGDMPQRGSGLDIAMTIEERRMIVRWVNGGAPEGSMPDGGVGFPDAAVVTDAGAVPWRGGPVASDAGLAGVRYVDVFANQGGDHTVPHTVPGVRTNYHCFVFTVPPHPEGADGEFVVEFTPLLDLRRNIHHMEIYRQDPAQPLDPIGTGGPEQWRIEPNYTWWDCADRSSQEQLIANFVPGQPYPIRMPRDVGYRIHAGDRLMLEIHYDSVTPPSGLDMSGFRLTTTTTQANIINAGEFWVGPLFNYDIAPTMNNGPSTEVAISSECVITRPVTVFWMKPHMHGRGVSQEFWIRRNGDAERTVLATVDPWDPGNQVQVSVPPSEQTFNVGDVVGTRCVYRTEGRDLVWGNGGNDEMCFFNMVHYPYTFGQSACWTRCATTPGACPVEYP